MFLLVFLNYFSYLFIYFCSTLRVLALGVKTSKVTILATKPIKSCFIRVPISKKFVAELQTYLIFFIFSPGPTSQFTLSEVWYLSLTLSFSLPFFFLSSLPLSPLSVLFSPLSVLVHLSQIGGEGVGLWRSASVVDIGVCGRGWGVGHGGCWAVESMNRWLGYENRWVGCGKWWVGCVGLGFGGSVWWWSPVWWRWWCCWILGGGGCCAVGEIFVFLFFLFLQWDWFLDWLWLWLWLWWQWRWFWLWWRVGVVVGYGWGVVFDCAYV